MYSIVKIASNGVLVVKQGEENGKEIIETGFDTKESADKKATAVVRRSGLDMRIKKEMRGKEQTHVEILEEMHDDIAQLKKILMRCIEESPNGKETGLKGHDRLDYVKFQTELYILEKMYRKFLTMKS
jgi:hypothetical protein